MSSVVTPYLMDHLVNFVYFRQGYCLICPLDDCTHDINSPRELLRSRKGYCVFCGRQSNRMVHIQWNMFCCDWPCFDFYCWLEKPYEQRKSRFPEPYLMECGKQ